MQVFLLYPFSIFWIFVVFTSILWVSAWVYIFNLWQWIQTLPCECSPHCIMDHWIKIQVFINKYRKKSYFVLLMFLVGAIDKSCWSGIGEGKNRFGKILKQSPLRHVYQYPLPYSMSQFVTYGQTPQSPQTWHNIWMLVIPWLVILMTEICFPILFQIKSSHSR